MNQRDSKYLWQTGSSEIIKEHSDMGQWQYVASKDNPTGHASRGIIGNKRHKIDQWFNSPSFLWKDTNEWPLSAKTPEFDSNNDPEIKRLGVVNMVTKNKVFYQFWSHEFHLG